MAVTVEVRVSVAVTVRPGLCDSVPEAEGVGDGLPVEIGVLVTEGVIVLVGASVPVWVSVSV